MSCFQTKVVFEQRAFDRTGTRDHRLSFRTVDAVGDEALVETVSACVSTSPDGDLACGVRGRGAKAVALEHVMNAAHGGAFTFEKSWWQVGFCGLRPVGFVLPAMFGGCDKDGLVEATFHIQGVLPEFRGRGFGTEHVIRGTQVMGEVGTWRVYNDADEENTPMLRAFRRAGHGEFGTIEKYGMHWHMQRG